MVSSQKVNVHCTHASLEERGPFSLPVLSEHGPRGRIRKSKSAKRRAIVLATVQLLIIAHIVLWLLGRKYGWFGGRTVTPVEPSESMQFVRDGVINAGLIFFVVTLVSTLIFGRFFCGWGCHIVMLQDFCAWLMKKCGVRPKLFRSRLLMYVPLLLALYMFVMPGVHRWGLIPLDNKLSQALGSDHWTVDSLRAGSNALGFRLPNPGLPPWNLTVHATTADFWQTFPRKAVVITSFLLVCGFAAVYFLGAKGFCTYGCPYGGFYAPLDRFAPGRILVTDACEQCGHCTAVCTSNVRVHDEVREYGMVVDPGCMKCLDCISVCPKDALYFGFGKPAVIKGAAKYQAPKKIYDLSLREELIFAGVFLLTFLAVRGVYDLVPMLMAAGIAGIVTFCAWKLWRLMRDPNLTLHRFQLKLRGIVQPAGWVFAGCTILVIAIVAHSGGVNAAYTMAGRHDGEVTIPLHVVFSDNPVQMTPEMSQHAAKAIELYQLSSTLAGSGFGLTRDWHTQIDIRLAWLHSAQGQFDQADRILRENLRTAGRSEPVCSTLALVLRVQQRDQDAMDFYTAVLLEKPSYALLFDEFAHWAIAGEAAPNVIVLCRQRLQRDFNDLQALRWHALASAHLDRVEEALALSSRWIELDPKSAEARRVQALALAQTGDLLAAAQSMQRAIDLTPENLELHILLADMLDQLSRPAEAARHRALAHELHQGLIKHSDAVPAQSFDASHPAPHPRGSMNY